MKVGDIKNLIKDVPDDVEFKINSKWDDDKDSISPSECIECHYDEVNEEVCVTPHVVSVAPHTNEFLIDVAAEIMDLFDDLLDKNDVTIPDEDDEERDENSSRIFGMTYFGLEDDIVNILKDI